MDYVRMFNPRTSRVSTVRNRAAFVRGDRRDGAVYVYTDEIVLAVNVALATGRPLLVYGPPGSGKSSVARNIARHLEWRYYEAVITSRTQAIDLQWRFDALGRLRDAQAGNVDTRVEDYIQPGPLWWAFDVASAARRGGNTKTVANDPDRGATGERAVVLIDEIDKADPDVPDALLVPIGAMQFRVAELDLDVAGDRDHAPLIIITSNGERELSGPFRRRCIEMTLSGPTPERLKEIAFAHFGRADNALINDVLAALKTGTDELGPDARPPSTAEFLDAIAACRELEADVSVRRQILDIALWKRAVGGAAET